MKQSLYLLSLPTIAGYTEFIVTALKKIKRHCGDKWEARVGCISFRSLKKKKLGQLSKEEIIAST